MKQPLAPSFACFLLLQLIVSGSSLAQDYPKLVEDRYISPITPFFMPQLEIDYELSGDSKKKYDEFIENYQAFKDEFESERQALENQYNAASGESKINKARELIELVLTYRALFDSLKYPGLGQFSGDYKLYDNFQLYGISTNFLYKGIGEVFLSDEISTDQTIYGRKIYGSVNGQLDFSGKVIMFNMQGSNNFSDTLSGYYFGDRVSVKQKSFVTEGSTTLTSLMPQTFVIEGEVETVNNESTGYLVLAMPGLLTTAEIDQNQVHTNLYTFDEDLNLYHVLSDNSPIENEAIYYYYTLNLIEPADLEEIPFQELIEKYFRYYVNSINNERNYQYVNTTNLDERKNIGTRTLEDLLGALTLAGQLGISPGVQGALRLVLKQKNSLFDIWFNLFFVAEDGSILEKLSQADGADEQESLYHERVENALNNIALGDIVSSEDLIRSLGLYQKSDYMSEIINDYFEVAQPQKCALDNFVYNQWKSGMIMLAQVYAQNYVIINITNATC